MPYFLVYNMHLITVHVMMLLCNGFQYKTRKNYLPNSCYQMSNNSRMLVGEWVRNQQMLMCIIHGCKAFCHISVVRVELRIICGCRLFEGLQILMNKYMN